jgi:hypothetical protein
MTAVLTQVDTRMPNRLQFKQALVYACLFGSFGLVSSAYAAQKVGAKVEAETVALPTDGSSLARDMPSRDVELVVVWGFRLRLTDHDLRAASLSSGYGELINKAACLERICGYVVLKDGDKWRTTNVIAASEHELLDMQANMEREGTTLVIVHPTGQRRSIPNF